MVSNHIYHGVQDSHNKFTRPFVQCVWHFRRGITKLHTLYNSADITGLTIVVLMALNGHQHPWLTYVPLYTGPQVLTQQACSNVFLWKYTKPTNLCYIIRGFHVISSTVFQQILQLVEIMRKSKEKHAEKILRYPHVWLHVNSGDLNMFLVLLDKITYQIISQRLMVVKCIYILKV